MQYMRLELHAVPFGEHLATTWTEAGGCYVPDAVLGAQEEAYAKFRECVIAALFGQPSGLYRAYVLRRAGLELTGFLRMAVVRWINGHVTWGRIADCEVEYDGDEEVTLS